MISYSDIKNHCEESSKLSSAVIDEFLIHYAAEKEKLVPQIDAQLKKYRSAAKELPDQYINFLKSEFIASRIFQKNGTIAKYLNHAAIKALPQEHYQFLEFQSQHPWHFSFGKILKNPENNFFEMEDAITGEEYLLYSPGMQLNVKEYQPRLWFNLIGYNGKCWQSFGLIIFLKSFTLDDIFFFATELNPLIENGEMLMLEVENNSFPFFMLLSASTIPVTVARGYEMVICNSTDIMESFSSEKLSEEFTPAWNKNVYRFTLKTFGEFPHFGIAYYHEQKKELIRTALTEIGFLELTQALSRAGYDLDPDADILVSQGMLSATEKILNKKIEVNPYDKLFKKHIDEKESENLKRLNHFLQLAITLYNAQKEIDIKRLAKEAGIDEETAASTWQHVRKNLDRTRGNK